MAMSRMMKVMMMMMMMMMMRVCEAVRYRSEDVVGPIVASAVLEACDEPRSPGEAVECVLASASGMLARAASEGSVFVVLPEATGWRWGLIAEESERRAALMQFAATVHVGDEPRCESTSATTHGVKNHDNGDKDRNTQSSAGDELVTGIACLARKFKIEVVFDTLTVQPCDSKEMATNCASDGNRLFNSAVAVTADGKVAAVYHKSHLYGTSPFLDEPTTPSAVSFYSPMLDRYVGLMVCYDLDFLSPAAEMLAAGVRTFAMPFDWPSTPPLMTPPMLMQAWSRSFGVTLIASNLYEAGGGSGIFSGGEILASLPANAQGDVVYASLPPLGTATSPPNQDDHTIVSERSRNSDDAKELHTNTIAGVSIGDHGMNDVEHAQIAAPQQFPCAVSTYPGFNGMCAWLGDGLDDDHDGVTRATHGNIFCDARVMDGNDVFMRASSRKLLYMKQTEIMHSTSSYVVFAFDGTIETPNTPDPLTTKVCAVMQCLTSERSGTDEIHDDVSSSAMTMCHGIDSGSFEAEGVDVRAYIQEAGLSPKAQLYAMAAVGSGELLPPSRLHVNSTSNIAVTSASLDLEQSPPLLALVLYILV